jgi:hypothetical protein
MCPVWPLVGQTMVAMVLEAAFIFTTTTTTKIEGHAMAIQGGRSIQFTIPPQPRRRRQRTSHQQHHEPKDPKKQPTSNNTID